MVSPAEIIEYYNGSKFDYQLYSRSRSEIFMHYGLWDANTANHADALRNENRVVAEAGGIGPSDTVLDLGCGYGTTGVWLAQERRCRVTGVTLGRTQVTGARRLASEHRVTDRAIFMEADFHALPFPDNSFSVVIAIESMCCSARKQDVLREARRVLQDKGRLVVADGFFGKDPSLLEERERRIASACFDGVHVPPLAQVEEFRKWLTDAGFQNVFFEDKTAHILKTARRVHLLGTILYPIALLLSALGSRALRPQHMRAFVKQYPAFRDGLGVYGIFCAEKRQYRVENPTT